MIEKYLDLTRAQYKAFMELPIDGPLKMLNLLKFKDRVGETGKTGAETYAAYLEATKPFFAKVNAKMTFYGTPQFTLIGPDGLEWDKVLIVEYATKQDFVKMISMEGYPSDLRKSALVDSRLIFCN